MGYFRERGFREDIIRKFQLGFSLEKKDAFTREALQKGYQKEYLLKTGLSLAYDNGELHDRYRARVMFPVLTLSGKVVAFGGRILKKEEKAAKYVNSPESEIYHKSNELYGMYFAKQAIAKYDKCFLVEGYTDVLSMHQAGIENVVASSGTALTHGQIRMIHRFTKNVTVLYDGDAAGIKASLKGINLLLEDGLNIKVLLLPDGEDPDSFSKKQSATEFTTYIQENETDFIRFKTNILLKDAGNDPIKRANLIQDLVESISLIADDITRSIYIKECSRQLDFDEKLLQTEVNKKRYNQIQREQQKRVADQSGFSRGTSNSPGSYKPSALPSNTGDVPPPPMDPGMAPPPSEDFYSGNISFPAGEALSQNSNPARVVPKANPAKDKFDLFERNIIKLIIRFGGLELGVEEAEDGTIHKVSVTEYVLADLEGDQIRLKNPLYDKILKEAGEKVKKNGFRSERHFLNHRDSEISLLTADLLSEPYELSKIHSRYQAVEKDQDKLDVLIPHVLVDLKNAIIQQKTQEVEEELRKAQQNKNDDEIMRLTKSLMEILEIKKDLAKNLGERIVVR